MHVRAGKAPEGAMIHTSRSYMKPLRRDDDASYRMSAVFEDPWSMAELRSWVPSQNSSFHDLPDT